jgi:predicted DNA-binding protein with PD1-like motif
MEYASMQVRKIYILRVDPGEDLLANVERFLEETGVRQAVVLGGYGTLVAYHIHWVTHDRIPTDNAFGRGQGGIEILSMNGLVVGGKPHIHMTLATQAGAFGGHLEPGCIAYVLCQVFLAEVEGLTLAYERVPVAIEGMGEGKVSRLRFKE